ncbi:MAG: alpha-galactosidase [Alistipes sp.]
MKILNILTLPLLAAATACGGVTTVTNGDLQLQIDKQMRVRVESLHATTQPFCEEFVATDVLVADEATLTDFERQSVHHNGDSYELVGLYDKDGIQVEKHQTITAPEDFPGMLLIKTFYINKGKSITATALESNNLRVNADSLIWSFEPSSTTGRKDWILPVRPGFEQQNYLGMNNSDYGGGIPMVTLWRQDGGVSVGVIEPTLKMISMPVQWRAYDSFATMGLRHDFKEKIRLAENDTLTAYPSFISVHTGDFYQPLHQYTQYMQQHAGLVLAASEPEAFEPVWCAWGYERTFTIDEVLGTLAKAAELGFKWVDVDDGFQIAEGDWETNSRFPGGSKDMRRLTDAIHAQGMKAKLWWAPLAADPDTKILREHPEMRLETEEGTPEYITWWNSYYLSPINPAVKKYTSDLVDRFINEWNFDGLKLDGQHLNCCLPDYNSASELQNPEDAVEQMPLFFKTIYDRARALKSYAVVQLCPCGCAINFYHLPYMNQAVASDPTSSWQIRLKGKAYKAINDRMAYYADHVELSDGGLDFPTQLGIGGVIGSKFTYPKNNPNVKEDFLLTPAKEVLYKKWVSLYNTKKLSTGDYLNLYDIAWDKPEAHVISKDGHLYYAFYADQWSGAEITLKGLDPKKSYTVCEYTADNAPTYTLDGNHPVITPTFKGSYLIEVY